MRAICVKWYSLCSKYMIQFILIILLTPFILSTVDVSFDTLWPWSMYMTYQSSLGKPSSMPITHLRLIKTRYKIS